MSDSFVAPGARVTGRVCPAPVALSFSPTGMPGIENLRSVPGTVSSLPGTPPAAASASRGRPARSPSHGTESPTLPKQTESNPAAYAGLDAWWTVACPSAEPPSFAVVTVTLGWYGPGLPHVWVPRTVYEPRSPASMVPAEVVPSPHAMVAVAVADGSWPWPTPPEKVATGPDQGGPPATSNGWAADTLMPVFCALEPSVNSSSSARFAAAPPAVAVTTSRYAVNVPACAISNGRVCTRHGKTCPVRASSVCQVLPSSLLPSRRHADGSPAFGPEVTVYQVARWPTPERAKVTEGVAELKATEVREVLSKSALASSPEARSVAVAVPRPGPVASLSGLGASVPCVSDGGASWARDPKSDGLAPIAKSTVVGPAISSWLIETLLCFLPLTVTPWT